MSVYVMNIWALNYRHDLVVNFSASRTRPHFIIWQKIISITQINYKLKLNQIYFNEIINKINKEDMIHSWVWILLSYLYMSRLHSWDSRKNRSVKVSRNILDDNSDEIKWLNDLTLWQRDQEKTSKILCSDVRNQDTVHSLSKKWDSLMMILKNQSCLKRLQNMRRTLRQERKKKRRKTRS